ncbi:MAG: hypothetical protein VB121_03740, partial [Enterococcus thailandicus]|nr:hypothetical protein [Enterococcus thailandicus]
MNPGKRTLAAIAAAVTLALPIAGCASAVDSSASSASTSSSTTSESASAGTTTTTSIDGVTSGTYTATFGNKEVTLSGAYLIDGVDVTIDSGTYTSTTADQAVFLVVNGGSLTVTGATIEKSGDATSNSEQNSGDVSDDYNFYGLNSAIVVVG